MHIHNVYVTKLAQKQRAGATMSRVDTPGVGGSGSGPASLSPSNIFLREACVVPTCYPKEEETVLPKEVKRFQDMTIGPQAETGFPLWENRFDKSRHALTKSGHYLKKNTSDSRAFHKHKCDIVSCGFTPKRFGSFE